MKTKMMFSFVACLRGLFLPRLIDWVAELSLKDRRFSAFVSGKEGCFEFSSVVSEEVKCSKWFKKSKTSKILEFSPLNKSMSKSKRL